MNLSTSLSFDWSFGSIDCAMMSREFRLEQGDFDFIPPVRMSAAQHLKEPREPSSARLALMILAIVLSPVPNTAVHSGRCAALK